jgi:hypothetical protein
MLRLCHSSAWLPREGIPVSWFVASASSRGFVGYDQPAKKGEQTHKSTAIIGLSTEKWVFYEAAAYNLVLVLTSTLTSAGDRRLALMLRDDDADVRARTGRTRPASTQPQVPAND